MADYNWRLEAKPCDSVDPDLFFPVRLNPQAMAERLCTIRDLCSECPVRSECLSEALRTGAEGIWAGTTKRERDEMAVAA